MPGRPWLLEDLPFALLVGALLLALLAAGALMLGPSG
jgi:hypothetical protein